jgi:hypothetical protein
MPEIKDLINKFILVVNRRDAKYAKRNKQQKKSGLKEGYVTWDVGSKSY